MKSACHAPSGRITRCRLLGYITLLPGRRRQPGSTRQAGEQLPRVGEQVPRASAAGGRISSQPARAAPGPPQGGHRPSDGQPRANRNTVATGEAGDTIPPPFALRPSPFAHHPPPTTPVGLTQQVGPAAYVVVRPIACWPAGPMWVLHGPGLGVPVHVVGPAPLEGEELLDDVGWQRVDNCG